jgi:hypothetical protein
MTCKITHKRDQMNDADPYERHHNTGITVARMPRTSSLVPTNIYTQHHSSGSIGNHTYVLTGRLKGFRACFALENVLLIRLLVVIQSRLYLFPPISRPGALAFLLDQQTCTPFSIQEQRVHFSDILRFDLCPSRHLGNDRCGRQELKCISIGQCTGLAMTVISTSQISVDSPQRAVHSLFCKLLQSFRANAQPFYPTSCLQHMPDLVQLVRPSPDDHTSVQKIHRDTVRSNHTSLFCLGSSDHAVASVRR